MELNLPVSVVTTIAQEYWREVRESLSDLKQDRCACNQSWGFYHQALEARQYNRHATKD